MTKGRNPIPFMFWRSATSREPVREWLNELPREDQRTIGHDIARVQFGWPVGLPVCRPMGKGLWEVRSSLPSQRIALLILCLHDQMLVVLHGFIKKTQKTAKGDLDLATWRMKEVTK